MASDQFYLFTALAAFNKDVQERLREAYSPEAVLAVAASHGYQITVEQLKYYARRLSGDYWSWINATNNEQDTVLILGEGLQIRLS